MRNNEIDIDKLITTAKRSPYEESQFSTYNYYSRRSSYRMALNDILLPIVPGKIKFTYKGKNETVDLINGGEINQIKTTGLTAIEFECLIPQTPYRFAVYRKNEFQPASYFLAQFEKMKKMKQPFKLKIIRRTQNHNGLYDTTLYVTLEEYSVEENADNGTDITVSIQLKQYKNYGSQLLKKKKKANPEKETDVFFLSSSKERKQKEKAKTYTVKSGDSLIRIAKKQLNNAAKSKELYNLNKTVIEDAAKKHGRVSSSKGSYLYAGTRLKLPS